MVKTFREIEIGWWLLPKPWPTLGPIRVRPWLRRGIAVANPLHERRVPHAHGLSNRSPRLVRDPRRDANRGEEPAVCGPSWGLVRGRSGLFGGRPVAARLHWARDSVANGLQVAQPSASSRPLTIRADSYCPDQRWLRTDSSDD